MKRTFSTNKRRRRKHNGFRARMKTKVRKVLKRASRKVTPSGSASTAPA